MRFNLRLMLVVVALIACACYVFIAPLLVRVPILFIAVVVMPAPLAVLLRNGGRKGRSFALGALVAYAAWLVIGGLPCAFFVASRFMGGGIQDSANIQLNIERFIAGYYPGYIGLYAPWIIVPLGGALGLLADWLVRDRSSE